MNSKKREERLKMIENVDGNEFIGTMKEKYTKDEIKEVYKFVKEVHELFIGKMIKKFSKRKFILQYSDTIGEENTKVNARIYNCADVNISTPHEPEVIYTIDNKNGSFFNISGKGNSRNGGCNEEESSQFLILMKLLHDGEFDMED